MPESARSEQEPDYARDYLLEVRARLAEQDPSIMELDVDDPQDRLSLVLIAAILKGQSLTLKTVEDGRTETVNFYNMGQDADGQPTGIVSFDSSDGTLSPDTAEMAAQLMQPELDSEIDSLLG